MKKNKQKERSIKQERENRERELTKLREIEQSLIHTHCNIHCTIYIV